MTPEILDWLDRKAKPLFANVSTVVEVGSRDVNGTPRSVLQRPDMTWTGLDVLAGPSVDVVTDAKQWLSIKAWETPEEWPDAIIMCEVLEHTIDPNSMIGAARSALAWGGWLVVTMPGFRFPYHGNADYKDYWRISADTMKHWLRGFSEVQIDTLDDSRSGLTQVTVAAIGRRTSLP